jgi:hypothetical protein
MVWVGCNRAREGYGTNRQGAKDARVFHKPWRPLRLGGSLKAFAVNSLLRREENAGYIVSVYFGVRFKGVVTKEPP